MFESFYLKVLVNIVISATKTTVYIETLNKKGVVSANETEFDTKYLSAKMHEHILSFTKETPFFYIAILDTSGAQGAIPTCSKHQMNLYKDLNSSEYKCFDSKWSYYTSKSDIYAIEKVYEKIGVDFIFSPFVVLANFFKDKIQTYMAMYILVQEKSLSLSVFKDSELLYADYLDISLEIDKNELEMEDTDLSDISLDIDEINVDLDGIDLDDIDSINDIDELDDFGDIEDLDSIEEMDEFNDTKDIEEELAANEDQEEFPTTESDGLNEDYQRFMLIQKSVSNFYKSEKFNSEFIENTYVADSIGVSSDFKKYLEEEMFLNVYVRHVDLAAEVCEVAKMELT